MSVVWPPFRRRCCGSSTTLSCTHQAKRLRRASLSPCGGLCLAWSPGCTKGQHAPPQSLAAEVQNDDKANLVGVGPSLVDIDRSSTPGANWPSSADIDQDIVDVGPASAKYRSKSAQVLQKSGDVERKLPKLTKHPLFSDYSCGPLARMRVEQSSVEMERHIEKWHTLAQESDAQTHRHTGTMILTHTHTFFLLARTWR